MIETCFVFAGCRVVEEKPPLRPLKACTTRPLVRHPVGAIMAIAEWDLGQRDEEHKPKYFEWTNHPRTFT